MSVMEMIYIDSDGHARKTGVGAAMESNEDTWRAFRSAKRLEVPVEDAAFLLDYYNRNGDLADTISLSSTGFAQITGERVLTEDQYREIDSSYWADVGHNTGVKPRQSA